MGQLSLTVVTSLVLFVTYFLVIFGVVVKASPVSSANTIERTAAEDALIPQQSQTDQTRNYGRVFKPFAYAYGFNRNIRTPFSNSMSQRQAPISMSHSRIQPLEVDLVVDDDNEFDKSKRYDDYGHMRFGKRGGDDQFDDYGHMRFGKRGE